jgi:uncharacterized OsmC-like protein
MGEVVYRSQVSVTREQGPLRSAVLPALDQPVLFGVHGAVAEHYGVDPDDQKPHTTTLDYLVAAAAGWLTGTFGGALEARSIPAAGGRLRSEAIGEIELDAKVLVVKRIHVTYHLWVDETVNADEAKRAAIDRVLGFHAERCPVARTIGGCVDITTSLELTTLTSDGRTPGWPVRRSITALDLLLFGVLLEQEPHEAL